MTLIPMPLPVDASVRHGRDRYLDQNGFTLEGYEEAWTKASFLALDFAVPNTPAHKRAIKLHDLHHVATGYGTDLAGEGEISAWELRGGLRGAGPYVSTIIAAGALMGLLVAPRRTVAAWRAAKGAKPLWAPRSQDLRYEDVLELTIGALRDEVGARRCAAALPEALASVSHGLHKNAPRPRAPQEGPLKPEPAL